MHVVVRIPGHVEVHHETDGGDIKTTTGDVGGDKEAGGGGAEAGEVGRAFGLWQQAVEGGDSVGETAEGAFEEVGGFGVVAEDDGGFGGVGGGG